MIENNEIMKFEEVMEYLNIGKSTLYNLLRSGEIRSFKIGKVWKIPRSAIEEYIRKSMNWTKNFSHSYDGIISLL